MTTKGVKTEIVTDLTKMILKLFGFPVSQFEKLEKYVNLMTGMMQSEKDKFVATLTQTIKHYIHSEYHDDVILCVNIKNAFEKHFNYQSFMDNFGNPEVYCDILCNKTISRQTYEDERNSYIALHTTVGKILEVLYANLKLFNVSKETSLATLKKIWSYESLFNQLSKDATFLVERSKYEGSLAKIVEETSLPDDLPESPLNYKNPKVRLHGRNSEMERLENFCASEKKTVFWTLIGSGGIGKSKLARELAKTKEFTMGVVWLDADLLNEILSLKLHDSSKVIYPQSILFICDYALSMADDLKKLIGRMKQNEDKYTSRFLLIDRTAQIHKQFTEADEIKGCEYSSPLDLNESNLSDEAYIDIITDYCAIVQPDKVISDTDYKEIINFCKERVSYERTDRFKVVRCLFLLLATDAYINGEDVNHWNAEKLTKYYIDRSKGKLLDNRYDSTTINNGYRLLAIATALGEMRIDSASISSYGKNIRELIDEFKSSLGNSKTTIEKFICEISEHPITDNTIPRLLPDIVGEYLFCSEYLDWADDATIDEVNKILRNSYYFEAEFLSRCIADWTDLGLKIGDIIAMEDKY